MSGRDTNNGDRKEHADYAGSERMYGRLACEVEACTVFYTAHSSYAVSSTL
jgi:hypothetical protein